MLGSPREDSAHAGGNGFDILHTASSECSSYEEDGASPRARWSQVLGGVLCRRSARALALLGLSSALLLGLCTRLRLARQPASTPADVSAGVLRLTREGAPLTLGAVVAAERAGSTSRAPPRRRPAEEFIPEGEPILRYVVCAQSKPVVKVYPRKLWLPTTAQQDECYNGVLLRSKIENRSQIGELRTGTGRNWCWVGLKEFGCHSAMFLHVRETWEQMKHRATGAAPRKDTYFPLLNHGLCDHRHLGKATPYSARQWHKAYVWFASHVSVYVVNRRSDTERWRAIHRKLTELKVGHERVEGVDVGEPGAIQKAKREGLIPESFDAGAAGRKASTAYQSMGSGILGTVGCAAAHFRAQATAFREAKSPIALVFEDDAEPEDDIVPRIWEMVHTELPCDWQVVSLSSMCPFGRCVSPHLTRVEPDVNEPADRCRHGVNYGFQGVLYKTETLEALQQRWKRVVFDGSRPHCLDLDVALASMSGEVAFYAVPNVQTPGFLAIGWQRESVRGALNSAKASSASAAAGTAATSAEGSAPAAAGAAATSAASGGQDEECCRGALPPIGDCPCLRMTEVTPAG